MNDIDFDLFNKTNVKCTGCSILTTSRPAHSIMDYLDLPEVEILFVSDSPKLYEGDYVAFRGSEYRTIMSKVRASGYLGNSIGFASSVKCPTISDEDMGAKDKKICRQHLEDTIKFTKPKLVFACGKLASTMFYGKKVDSKDVRGKAVTMEMGEHQFTLVCLFHPYQVVVEPKNDFLFSVDIKNNIESIILGVSRSSGFKYKPIMCQKDFDLIENDFEGTDRTITIDIECTGLNFLKDKVNSIALSMLDYDLETVLETVSFPFDHITSPITPSFRSAIIAYLKNVMANKRNRKALQNANYDLKFLKREGIIEIYSIWDTKLMQHLLDEESPKSLSDLVAYYFPNENMEC
jgi:uracil-DNA glycosylase family 4